MLDFLVKILKAMENVTHKCGPRILRFFDVLPIFSFITWGTEIIISNKNGIYKLPPKLLKSIGF